jgi:hypothetical protein
MRGTVGLECRMKWWWLDNSSSKNSWCCLWIMLNNCKNSRVQWEKNGIKDKLLPSNKIKLKLNQLEVFNNKKSSNKNRK